MLVLPTWQNNKQQKGSMACKGEDPAHEIRFLDWHRCREGFMFVWTVKAVNTMLTAG